VVAPNPANRGAISMAQANSLSTIGITAVKVLARLAAKRAVQQSAA
jgi:hypothetical protein